QLYRPIMKKEETVESEPIFTVTTPPDPERSDLEPTAGSDTSYPDPKPSDLEPTAGPDTSYTDPKPSDLEPTAGPDTSYTERMKQWIIKILKDTEE
ncbi:MAG: hypothetical protein II314_05445, partial [Prevotella sp.]|nr:hypothetical protein [Prevotella sp.]